MTKKLYYDNSYIKSFDATVTEIHTEDKFTVIELDKTAFFPLGGGQLPDTGKIGNADISDVKEIDGRIFHFTRDKFEYFCGDTVSCEIDWNKRFSRMQSHSGEHIVSGLAKSLFDADNVGFHMDEDNVMTVDFNRYLSSDEIEDIERKANECIWKNARIKTAFYDLNECVSVDYRSKLEFEYDVRLVEIEGYDICACCAPHVNNTGEIGSIKILSCISHRGGVRLTMICGYSAYSDYHMKHNATVKIATALCAKHNETDEAVQRLIESNKALEYKISCSKKKYLKIISDDIKQSDTILRFFDDLSVDDLRELCNFCKDKCKYFILLLSGDDSSGYSYCIYSSRIDLSRFIKCFNSSLNGSGGGRGELVQGKIKCNKNDVNLFMNVMRFDDYENAKKKES